MRWRLAGALVLVSMLRSAPALAQVSPGPLAEAHAELDEGTQCFRCHPADRARSSMDGRCLDCHQDVAWTRANRRGYHTRVAEKPCASCHPDHGGRGFALIAWDGGSPEKFDHTLSGFPLEGKHRPLACRDCHRPAFMKAANVPMFRRKDRAQGWLGLETACASCHSDPHKGSLGSDCTSCHTQTAWKPAPGFDHAKTKYALTGAHTKPACEKCHATAEVNGGTDASGALRPRWRPVPHQDCVSCHKDPHKGRFTGACAKCHVTSGWKAVNKQGFDHDQTRYPLKGAHVNVKCEGCHEARLGGPRPRFARCIDCHKDTHNGTATIAGKPAADCAVCHDVRAFRPSTWPLANHQRTKYPLDGAHALTACEKCHTRAPERSAEAATLGSARVRMRPVHGTCVDCHRDPHAGRFSPGGARPHQSGCTSCHSMSAFDPSTYDGRAHADCVFPLEGAHMAIPCQRCHTELDRPADGSSLKGSPEKRPLRFDSKARACRDCHEDAHRGQFAARKDKGACESCHGFASFVPASKFDHDRDSEFHLQGAHARTPCAACHRTGLATASAPPIVVYRPTPDRCEQCHAPSGDTPQKRAPQPAKPGSPSGSRLQSRTGR